MKRFFVHIKRDGFKPSCYKWTSDKLPERFDYNEVNVWGVVEAKNTEDAMAKLVDYAYENDLWYGIGGKRPPLEVE